MTSTTSIIAAAAHTQHDGKSRRYVVGLLFRGEGAQVALILKDRPERLRGLYNGLGGKVEVGETPAQAMPRECKEEAGAEVSTWEPFALLRHPEDAWSMVIFKAFAEVEIRTVESEQVAWHQVSEVRNLPCVSHLNTLIVLALEAADSTAIITVPS